MNISCRSSGKSFEVSEEDLKFYETISPVFNGQKYLIPPPTLCPDERRRRRLAFRNERLFFKGQCDLCDKKIISAYSEDKPYTVYCSECWWGDGWEAMKYGREFDFSRPFFDQFNELLLDVPRLGILNAASENSDYCRYGYNNKDCYLLSTSDDNEKCYYGVYVWSSFDCLDCLFLIDSKHCYQCLDSDSLYECFYCQGCTNCQNCWGCIDSKNLKNCLGCVNLVNKEYCFFNEQLSQGDYEKRVKEAMADIPDTLARLREFSSQFPRRATVQINCENSEGDHIKNCMNAYMCFDGYGAEDSKWIVNFPGGVVNCYDFDGCSGLEWCYEGIAMGRTANMVHFSDHVFNAGNENILYSSYCISNKNLFGCAGLFKKEYCVFNKQYSKEEYEELVPRIIGHMKNSPVKSPFQGGRGARSDGGGGDVQSEAKDRGVREWGEFFPISLSPFGYNETAAQEIFPLTKEEALSKGWKWKDEEKEDLKVDKIIPGAKVPHNIDDIPDDILNWAIECEITKKPFKIIPQELNFYRKYKLSVPSVHPDERHKQRMSQRNPQNLWERSCDSCQNIIMSSFPPEDETKVRCNDCYLKEVY